MIEKLAFTPMLCSPKLPAFQKENTGDFEACIWSLKLDGVRTLCAENELSLISGSQEYYSRSGKVFRNFTKFNAGMAKLRAAFKKHGFDNVIFDGEVTDTSGDFQTLMKNVRRKNSVNTSGFQFHIFDVFIPGSVAPLRHRIRHLTNAFGEVGGAYLRSQGIYLVPHGIMDFQDEGDVQRFAQRFMDMGCEGIVLKTIHGTYQQKRHPSWCKIKARPTLDAVIIDIIAGQGKHEGRMGALVCKTMNPDGDIIEFEVGTGFTDEEREHYWETPFRYTHNTVIEVAYGRFSNGNKSLIWPSFVRKRDDKTAKDVYENSDQLPPHVPLFGKKVPAVFTAEEIRSPVEAPYWTHIDLAEI